MDVSEASGRHEAKIRRAFGPDPSDARLHVALAPEGSRRKLSVAEKARRDVAELVALGVGREMILYVLRGRDAGSIALRRKYREEVRRSLDEWGHTLAKTRQHTRTALLPRRARKWWRAVPWWTGYALGAFCLAVVTFCATVAVLSARAPTEPPIRLPHVDEPVQQAPDAPAEPIAHIVPYVGRPHADWRPHFERRAAPRDGDEPYLDPLAE